MFITSMMKVKQLVKKKAFFAVLVLLVIMVSVLVVIYKERSTKSALYIESIPSSIVYIDGNQVGKTPYQGEFSKREIRVKLVADSFSTPIDPYESDISLHKGVKTVLKHEFNPDPEKEVTESLSFSDVGGSNSSISVVTIPDGARVRIDGKESGVSPIRVDNLVEGQHTISVESFSYNTRIFDVQTKKGLLLTSFVDLAKNDQIQAKIEEKKADEEASQPEPASPYKKLSIVDTPTGFLRIRDRPGVDGQEIGRATPGETFDVISYDAEGGWYQIDFDSTASGKLTHEGWVSARYASPSGELSTSQ